MYNINYSENDSINKVLRIGAFDYEPSPVVKQVIFETKLNKGFTNYESKDDREKYYT